MKKIYLVSIVFLVCIAPTFSQVLSTPSKVNISKSYLPFNAVTVDVGALKITIGESFKKSTEYRIVKMQPAYSPSVKSYCVEAIGSDGKSNIFKISVSDKVIKRCAQLTDDYREDWVLSE